MSDTPTGGFVVNPTPAPARGLFGTKLPSSVSFLVALLLFFMPFVDIRCNAISIAKVNGVELATGFKIKSPGSDNSLVGTLENTSLDQNTNSSGDKRDANMFALAALVIGVLGLVVSLLNARLGGTGGLICGVLAGIALIALMVDINNQLSKEKSTGGLEAGMVIRADFTPWFYISVIAFFVAAFLSYRRTKAVL